MNEVGTTPKEVTALVAKNFPEFFPVRLRIKVTIPADDSLRREVQEETDERVNGGVEGLGVPVRFCFEAVRRNTLNGLVLGHFIDG